MDVQSEDELLHVITLRFFRLGTNGHFYAVANYPQDSEAWLQQTLMPDCQQFRINCQSRLLAVGAEGT